MTVFPLPHGIMRSTWSRRGQHRSHLPAGTEARGLSLPLHTGAAPQQEAQARHHVGRSRVPPSREAPGLPTWRRAANAGQPPPRQDAAGAAQLPALSPPSTGGEPAGQSGIVGRVHHSLSPADIMNALGHTFQPGEEARGDSTESLAELSAPFPSALGEAPSKPARPHSPAPRPSPVTGRGGRAGLGRAGQGEAG